MKKNEKPAAGRVAFDSQIREIPSFRALPRAPRPVKDLAAARGFLARLLLHTMSAPSLTAPDITEAAAEVREFLGEWRKVPGSVGADPNVKVAVSFRYESSAKELRGPAERPPKPRQRGGLVAEHNGPLPRRLEEIRRAFPISAGESLKVGGLGQILIRRSGAMRKAAMSNVHDVEQLWTDGVARLENYDPHREHLVVIPLNNRLVPFGWVLLTVGTDTECVAHAADVLRSVLLCGAERLILVHNHPSGICSPSSADRTFTFALRKAAEVAKMSLLDHVIVGTNPTGINDSPFSFREEGLV